MSLGFTGFVERSWRENLLWTVLFELTYRCNLSCFYCYNDLGLRGRPLALGEYRRIFDELAELQVMNLILTGGEPLVHPQFLAIAGHARDRGFAIRLKSNGHRLRGRLAARIRDEVDPFVIDVSLHGATAAVHDRQTRMAGSFERLRANLGEARELGLRVKLNATLTRWNEHEIEAMYALADALGLPLAVYTEVTARDDGDRSPLQIAPSAQGIARLLAVQRARSAAAGASRSDEPSRAATAPGEKYCGAGSSSLAVDPVGNVYPCVQWRVPIGNLRDRGVGDLWRDSPALAGVRATSQTVAAMIRREPAGRQMAFCPGAAHAASGDATAIHEAPRQRAWAVTAGDRRRGLPVVD